MINNAILICVSSKNLKTSEKNDEIFLVMNFKLVTMKY